VPDTEPFLVSKEVAAKLLSISIDTFERSVMPDVRVVRIGRRVLFSVADLGEWVEAHAAVPLRSELPQHTCEKAAPRGRETASLPRSGRAMVDRTNHRAGRRGITARAAP
jgi:hypothetical protein